MIYQSAKHVSGVAERLQVARSSPPRSSLSSSLEIPRQPAACDARPNSHRPARKSHEDDAALDLVGVVAADWATEGLQRAGMPDIVPTTTAISARRAMSPRTTRRPSLTIVCAELADETGASTVVAGALYRDGDSLRFKVQVSDQHGTHLLNALPDIAAINGRPDARRLASLRTRLMGWLALQFTDRLGLVRRTE